MGAGIEWLIGILRAGPDFGQYGDPYTFSGTIVIHGEEAEIKGASMALTTMLIRERSAVSEALRAIGVKRVSWDRRKDGKVKRVTRYIGDMEE